MGLFVKNRENFDMKFSKNFIFGNFSLSGNFPNRKFPEISIKSGYFTFFRVFQERHPISRFDFRPFGIFLVPEERNLYEFSTFSLKTAKIRLQPVNLGF